jgi:hypothetical protein
MTKNYFGVLLLISGIAFTLSSCYYDFEDELYGVAACDIPASVTYTTHIEPIISQSCAISGCHVTGGGGNGNFETFAGVQGKVSNGSFEETVLISGSMPPSGNLSSCDLQLIEAWLTAGSPE